MSDDKSDEDDEDVMQPAMQVCTKVLGFQRLRTTKEDQFYGLDWTDVPKDFIEALFSIKVGKYGCLDHPPAYLKSTALVEQWRMIGGSEQQNVIDRLEEEEEIERRAQATSSARERRSNRRSVEMTLEMTFNFTHLPGKSRGDDFRTVMESQRQLLMNPELKTRIKFLPGMLTLSEMSFARQLTTCRITMPNGRLATTSLDIY